MTAAPTTTPPTPFAQPTTHVPRSLFTPPTPYTPPAGPGTPAVTGRAAEAAGPDGPAGPSVHAGALPAPRTLARRPHGPARKDIR